MVRKLNISKNQSNNEETMNQWVASKYNVFSRGEDGTLLLYNSYTGAMGGIDQNEEKFVNSILKNGYKEEPKGITQDLVSGGMLVKRGTNENNRSELMRKTLDRSDYLHLIIMPTEQCNFRCEYCYESFQRGEMEKSVIEGTINLISSKLKKLNYFTISWFGGEPLLASNVIFEITDSFIHKIDKYDVNYNANVTTNGYFLNLEMCTKLTQRGITHFNVTLDGLQKDHDSARFLHNGKGTYNVIIKNLIELKESDLNFKITIRCNFNQNTNIDSYILYLRELFSEDERFSIYFRPVGKWGGCNDEELDVYEGREAGRKMLEADLSAAKNKLNVSLLDEIISPLGSVCYAAKPNSVVIGSNGTLYKCTVALESDFNHVGKIESNGNLVLDYDKLSKWVISGSSDNSICKECFFRPSCHGDACPLVRIETNNRPCPKEKEHIKQTLKVIWEQHKNSISTIEPTHESN
ncbi:radical SAM/SPASM domain-containing protein [Paraliobacillus ryukyuensis]|uniref:radical SAM/SPASM domain-containing protein n=1 Tax=Paraliobacillus ryukyuensis TaxID=200904 RepID=UPI0009A671EE|nr:radical SAM protein [Paraliobacillus ryukyuensis]